MSRDIQVFLDEHVPQFDKETGQRVMWRIPIPGGRFQIWIHPDNKETMFKVIGRTYGD